MNNFYANANNNYYGYGMPQYQPMIMNNQMPMPIENNALTAEEINQLKQSKSANNELDITVTPIQALQAMCTHKDNGRSVVVPLSDGSGDVYCPICGKRWDPNGVSDEELKQSVDTLVNQFQNIKMVGNLPTDVIRAYMQMIPLLEKAPALNKVAMNTAQRYYNANGILNPDDVSMYSMYNSLFNTGYGAYGQYPPINNYNSNPYAQQQSIAGYNTDPYMQQQPIAGYNPQYTQQSVNGYVPNPMQASVNPYAQPVIAQQDQSIANQYMQTPVNPYMQPAITQQPQQNPSVVNSYAQPAAATQPQPVASQQNQPIANAPTQPQQNGTIETSKAKIKL